MRRGSNISHDVLERHIQNIENRTEKKRGCISYEPRREKTGFLHMRNKGADQLCGNRYTDSTIPLLSKSEISSLYSTSVVVQPSLCRTWSQTPKTGFLTTRLISYTSLVDMALDKGIIGPEYFRYLNGPKVVKYKLHYGRCKRLLFRATKQHNTSCSNNK